MYVLALDSSTPAPLVSRLWPHPERGVTMEIESLATAVHEALEAHPLQADAGYAPEVKEAGIAYARHCRGAGEIRTAIGSRVPVSHTTLRKWLVAGAAESKGPALRLVPGAGPVFRSPQANSVPAGTPVPVSPDSPPVSPRESVMLHAHLTPCQWFEGSRG